MENITQIILHVIGSSQFGKYKLASFLKGSKSKDILPVSNKDNYGRMSEYDTSVIEGFIDQLETNGFIRRIEVSRFYSYYVLTDSGRKVINENIEIHLKEIKKYKPITVGDSEKQTLSLIKQGKTVAEIAQIRNLAESTIYTHGYRLIVNEQLISSEILSEETCNKIKELCLKFEKQPPLKELKELLPEEITYEQIRCITAEVFRIDHGS